MKINKHSVRWVVILLAALLATLTICGYAFSDPACVASCVDNSKAPEWVIEHICRIRCWLNGINFSNAAL